MALYRKVANDPEQVNRYAKDLPPDKWDRYVFDHAFVGLGIGIAFLCVVLGPVWGLVAAAFHTVTYLALSGAVNAVGHHFGRKPYENSATNLQWLAFLTAGEGLHNNHHAAPTSAKLALRRPEIDPAWWFISVFRRLGWVTIRLDKVVLRGCPQAAPRPDGTVAAIAAAKVVTPTGVLERAVVDVDDSTGLIVEVAPTRGSVPDRVLVRGLRRHPGQRDRRRRRRPARRAPIGIASTTCSPGRARRRGARRS